MPLRPLCELLKSRRDADAVQALVRNFFRDDRAGAMTLSAMSCGGADAFLQLACARLSTTTTSTTATAASSIVAASPPTTTPSFFFISKLVVPLVVTQSAANLYGFAHGGSTMTTGDTLSSLHALLNCYAASTTSGDHGCGSTDRNWSFIRPGNVTTVASSCRFHNAVPIQSPLLAISTAISPTVFHVDLAFASPCMSGAPLAFDAKEGKWSLLQSSGQREEQSPSKEGEEELYFEHAAKTYTRGIYTKNVVVQIT